MKILAGDSMFKVLKLQMFLAGHWPMEHWSKQTKLLYNIYSYFASFMNYSSTPMVAAYFFIKYFVESQKEKGIQVFSFFAISSLVSLKSYLCTRPPFIKLINEGVKQGNATSEKYYSVAGTYLKYCNILNNFIWVFSFIGVTGYAVIVRYQIYQFRITHPGQEPTHLLIHWHPFNTTKYFIYGYYTEISRGVFFGLNNSLAQSLFTTLTIHSASQFKLIKNNFKSFHLNGSRDSLADKKNALLNLKKCIEGHQTIIRYVEDINDVVKLMLLVEYNISSLNIASVLFQILKGKNVIFNITYALILVIQLIVLYCNANEIHDQSEEVSFGIYESQWYQYNKNIQQIVFIISMRAAKPISLTIGPFGGVTARTALERLKLAYSYVSVMPGDNS